MSLGCFPEPTWWNEKTDLHTGAVACIVSSTPAPTKINNNKKSESDILKGKENSARLQICPQLCTWLSAPDKTSGPREQ